MESDTPEVRVQYEIAKWGVFLMTRERGRQVREDIEKTLGNLASGDVLALSFAGIEGVTVSFGDESLAKLILDRMGGSFVDRGIVITDVNTDVHETLDAVFGRRKVSAVMLTELGEPKILGEPGGWLPATLAVAMELRSFSASELAERLHLTPQAANNRLKALVATGAVARELIVPEGGGKEFSYTVVVPAFA